MRLFHIATAADWAAAVEVGRYTTATRGRTLAEEGFVHCCRADQWPQVRQRWYADVEEPLVLLVIDEGLLGAPIVEEPVADGHGGAETYPHVYGPIEVDAVLQALPLRERSPVENPVVADTFSAAPATDPPEPPTTTSDQPELSFSRIYFEEVLKNLVAAVVVLALAVLGALLGLASHVDFAPQLGALAGAAIGVLGVRWYRRRPG